MRHQATGGLAVHRSDQVQVQLPSIALIGQRGVGVAVANHNGASNQRRPDHLRDVMGTVGQEQKRLRPWGQRFIDLKEALAQLCAQRRAARFEGADRLRAERGNAIRQRRS